MPKIKNLNPLPMADIGGSDLFIPFRMPTGEIGYVLDDPFSGGEPRMGGTNWRSPPEVSPLPPGCSDSTAPPIVSPAVGSRSALAIRSRLMLPTTVTAGRVVFMAKLSQGQGRKR